MLLSFPLAGSFSRLPLHAGAAPPFLPHWAVLIVATATLGAAIAVGVAVADRLLDRLAA